MIYFELDSIGNRVSMGLTDRRKTVEISAIGGELLIDITPLLLPWGRGHLFLTVKKKMMMVTAMELY